MFAVYGRLLKKEESKKQKFGDSTTPEERFNSKKGGYRISPVYHDINRCYDFINLAKTQKDVRCLYIAQLEPVYIKGEPKLDKKTGCQKCSFKKIKTI